MTEENKFILRQELCERLPYGLKCKIWYRIQDDSFLENEAALTPLWLAGSWKHIEDVTPYLRPMSSMTEEEKKELLTLLVGKDAVVHFQVENNGITNTDEKIQLGDNWKYHWLNFSNENISLYLDWLRTRHFDYRGLIGKGIALEAPEGMYECITAKTE